MAIPRERLQGHLAVSRNANDESEVDDSLLNVGLFTYPFCKLRTLLLIGKSVVIHLTFTPFLNDDRATPVPVGENQQQYRELTRDLAESFNRTYRHMPMFQLPELMLSA
jgi:tryptophanyl-tRNA synthetase